MGCFFLSVVYLSVLVVGPHLVLIVTDGCVLCFLGFFLKAYAEGTKVSLILANGEELTCEPLPGAANAIKMAGGEQRLGLLDFASWELM